MVKKGLTKRAISSMRGLQAIVGKVEDPAAREALETIRSTLLELLEED